MAKMGSFSVVGMKNLQKQLNKIQQEQASAFIDECAKELAARLLAKVIKRTPVGDYSQEIEVLAKRDSKHHKKGDVYTKRINPSGKMGGTLRRGWTSQTQEKAEKGKGKPSAEQVAAFVNSLKIERNGNMLTLEIVNPVEYASYVEYGHRQTPGRYVPALGKRLTKGWAPGHFMLTISEREVQKIAPGVLQKKIKKFLGECLQ